MANVLHCARLGDSDTVEVAIETGLICSVVSLWRTFQRVSEALKKRTTYPNV